MENSEGKVSKMIVDNRIILVIDYTNLKEDGMIALVSEAREIVLKENQPLLILSCFFNNYITPKYKRHAEAVTAEVRHLIDKQAIVGLTSIQKMILKGYNLLMQRNFKAFETREEAVRYLLDKNTTDHDLPDFYQKK
jgi:hypothetical protein